MEALESWMSFVLETPKAVNEGNEGHLQRNVEFFETLLVKAQKGTERHLDNLRYGLTWRSCYVHVPRHTEIWYTKAHTSIVKGLPKWSHAGKGLKLGNLWESMGIYGNLWESWKANTHGIFGFAGGSARLRITQQVFDALQVAQPGWARAVCESRKFHWKCFQFPKLNRNWKIEGIEVQC